MLSSIKKTQIETQMWYHYNSVEWLKLKIKIPSVSIDMEKLECSRVGGRSMKRYNHLAISLAISFKLTIDW